MISCLKYKIYASDYPDNTPEWYRVNGLHDACITDISTEEYTFDYNEFVKDKCKYKRNVLTFKIDAQGALYDTRVKEIRFYNYKIISECFPLNVRNKIWWMADRLVDCGEYYTLETDLIDYDSRPEEFTCKLKFGWSEVDR